MQRGSDLYVIYIEISDNNNNILILHIKAVPEQFSCTEL